MSKTTTLSDGRWSCKSCGACCRGFSFGPVEEHIIEGLKEKDIATHWEPAQEEWYVTHPKSGDFYFTHVDGHCIFLQEDQMCAIHARWGALAKPWFCREYPFSVVEHEQGLSITVRDDCGGFHKSMDDGQIIEEQVEEVLNIIRPVPRQQFAPQQVVILPGLGVSVLNWLQVEPVILQACHGSAKESVIAIRTALYNMAGREKPTMGMNVEDGFSMLVEALADRIGRVPVDSMMEESKQYLLSILQSPIDHRDVQEGVEEYFVRIIRTRILSKSFARLGSLPAGLGFFLLEWYIFSHRGERKEIGIEFSRWRRAIHLRPFWEQIRSLSTPFSHIFVEI